MRNKPKNYYKAVAVIVGYVIGVGMFSLPYVVSRAGLLAFFVLLALLGPIQYLLHLIYANIIVVTKDYHRLPGYAGIYLGKNGKKLVFAAKLIGNYSGLLAYIIITGIFLHQLLSPHFGGSEFLYATILFALEAIVVYFGIGMIARAELVMTGLLLVVVVLIIAKGYGAIDAANYHLVSWPYFLLPYGAMLFAIDGNGSLPMVGKLLNRNKEAIKSVVRIGTLLPIVVIIAFTLVIVGISGSRTTPDSLIGIGLILNNGVILFSLIFGILTMITSFFGVAESIRETLWWDFKVNKNMAWALAVFVPYILYLSGFQNLIHVISFAGAIAGGFCAIIMIRIFIKLKAQKEKLVLFKYKPNRLITSCLIGLFILGILYEVYYFIVQ